MSAMSISEVLMRNSGDIEDLSSLDHTETVKADSHYLRGTIREGLDDPVTGAIGEDDAKLLRYHGSYLQDDRDIRDERRKQKLEPAYQFMIRVRVPGGVVTPSQWLAMDRMTRDYGSGTLRVTSRQTFQVHCILKENLKNAIASVNACLLDTFATSGDVNRNVLCSSNPMASRNHAVILEWARTLSNHLLPKSNAYHELWLDGERVDPEKECEPLYGKRYLPRKFKIAIAVPPTNDIDVFKEDLGLIAIFDGEKLQGFNLTVGGGLATTHGDRTTYPRLGDLIGFVTPYHVIAAAEHVIGIQRDFGDRVSRRHSRLKYTVDKMGVGAFKEELERRIGFQLDPVRPYAFDRNGDRFGWTRTPDDLWHLCLYLRAGRIANAPDTHHLDGMRAIAEAHDGQFRLTSNQNVIVANISPDNRDRIESIVKQYGLDEYQHAKPVRLDAISCVALPTCGLAMAEAERYLPQILQKIEAILERHGLQDDPILFRISGCPNGCSRPYLGEIALIGRALGRYDLRLGADNRGERLNTVYRENIDELAVLGELDALFARYTGERVHGESFGDFVRRVIPLGNE